MNNIQLIRRVDISAAFDKRNENPSKNYGIHGVDLRFLLSGEEGVVQFLLFTNWMIPSVRRELDKKKGDHLLCQPLPADLGYHSRVPLYEGQGVSHNCEYLNGDPCYSDGSVLNARRIYDVMVAKGGEAMWKEMEEYYIDTFDQGKEK